MMPKRFLLCLSILFSSIPKCISVCNKLPDGVVNPRNRNDIGKYILEIPGNPQNYTPNQKYNITLKISPRVPPKTFRHFMITLEPDEGNEEHLVGQLDIETYTLARISQDCRDTVVESSLVPKTEIKVYWTAPPKGSGCIAIKATVVESKENWFSEDGQLTKKLCEETLQNENSQPEPLQKCCACDEAKYEVGYLQSRWHLRENGPETPILGTSPVDQWSTKFSDIIGASHQFNHAFWNYERMATEGLKELAEAGSTRTLESELKNNSEHIRTIIKARGLQYPYITKSTYAVFRVDNKNHLVSLVSKITPSPDWIVGVANLELCNEDCTWEEYRTLNLYPWDAGTNDGLKYDTSVPTDIHQPIRRITPNNPNDPNSPFYSENGEDMKPIAKLHLTRQRIYPKACEPDVMHGEECATKDWSEWSPCSATCGQSTKYRQRTFVDPDNAEKCHTVQLTESEGCFNRDCSTSDEMMGNNENQEMDSEKENDSDNLVPDSVTCGDEDCKEDPNCPGTFWGKWSECNVTCGKGIKERRRLRMKDQENNDEEDMGPNCAFSETEECEVSCNNADSSKTIGFGDLDLPNSIIISQESEGKVIDCKVSKWSRWSECIFPNHASCGEGYKYKSREIIRHNMNGGKTCPKDLKKVRRCALPCTEKCLMSRWSNWTPCSSNCGGSAVQIRTRQIIYQPPNVNECPAMEDKRQCRLPITCTEDGQPLVDI